ncbi:MULTISPECIES: hypothetical protein [Candidatus Ichthyocystis]|nr:MULTISPECIES: hypothetical protein [Ichthyocystis]
MKGEKGEIRSPELESEGVLRGVRENEKCKYYTGSSIDTVTRGRESR